MLRLFLAVAGALVFAVAGCVPVPQEREPSTKQVTTPTPIEDGWISLFDGETQFGWQAEGDANWRVEEGSIVVDAGDPGLLRTKAQFDNYELRVDFRCDAETNSGIFLRTAPTIEKDEVTTSCYELNIAPADNSFPTGSLVRRKKVDGDFQSDDWQTYHVTVDGATVIVRLNGKRILEYSDPKPLGRGYIGLQHNTGRIEFRNIWLKPLGLEAIFDGENLDEWRATPKSEAEFTVEDGELRVLNGPGNLESKTHYGDFVLQLDCRSHAEHLNSGVFFRCIPSHQVDDVMAMGYESQIHNGFESGDRTIPMDCGTGGIFRRVDARKVVANDKEWFHKTIIAEGSNIAVWVNGYQVTDWTDEREPNENPRRGLRVEPGTIMLQGHDATTDFSFRNIKARELKARR